MSAPIRILGIDPGLNTTGYAVITNLDGRPKMLEAGVVKSADVSNNERIRGKPQSRPDRRVCLSTEGHKIDAVIEEPAS